MYRILKHVVKKPEHRRILRHIFGTQADEVPTNDFRDALLRGEIPKNIDEMERNYPMLDLLLMEGSRLKGLKILVAYFLGDTFLVNGLFPQKVRTSGPHADPSMGTYVSREALSGAVITVCEGTNSQINKQSTETFERLNRRDGVVEEPFPVRSQVSRANREADDFARSG